MVLLRSAVSGALTPINPSESLLIASPVSSPPFRVSARQSQWPPENTPAWIASHQSSLSPNPRYPTRPKDIHRVCVCVCVCIQCVCVCVCIQHTHGYPPRVSKKKNSAPRHVSRHCLALFSLGSAALLAPSPRARPSPQAFLGSPTRTEALEASA